MTISTSRSSPRTRRTTRTSRTTTRTATDWTACRAESCPGLVGRDCVDRARPAHAHLGGALHVGHDVSVRRRQLRRLSELARRAVGREAVLVDDSRKVQAHESGLTQQGPALNTPALRPDRAPRTPSTMQTNSSIAHSPPPSLPPAEKEQPSVMGTKLA